MCQCFRVRSQAGVHVDIQLDYWIAKQISPLGALEGRDPRRNSASLKIRLGTNFVIYTMTH